MDPLSPLVRQFVYRLDATAASNAFTPADIDLAYESVAVDTADGVSLSGWYLPAENATQALLYCHGNAGDIRDWVHAALPFVGAGVSVLVWDYRGYGRSEGAPSEEGLYRDGEAAWRWLRARAEREGLPVAILGKSLGSAVAIHIAAGASPAALVLDSAFTSMREVVTQVVPWAPVHLVPRLFESLERAPAVTSPTLVVHGGRDSLVPVAQGRRLYEALTAPKAWRVIEAAGHNDVSTYPQYYEWVLAFLAEPVAFVESDGDL